MDRNLGASHSDDQKSLSRENQTSTSTEKDELLSKSGAVVRYTMMSPLKPEKQRCYKSDCIFIVGLICNLISVVTLSLTELFIKNAPSTFKKGVYVGCLTLLAIIGIVFMCWGYHLAKLKPVGTPSPQQQGGLTESSQSSVAYNEIVNVEQTMH
jgi:hypothetical protein